MSNHVRKGYAAKKRRRTGALERLRTADWTHAKKYEPANPGLLKAWTERVAREIATLEALVR